jgi:hypothetical protein
MLLALLQAGAMLVGIFTWGREWYDMRRGTTCEHILFAALLVTGIWMWALVTFGTYWKIKKWLRHKRVARLTHRDTYDMINALDDLELINYHIRVEITEKIEDVQDCED